MRSPVTIPDAIQQLKFIAQFYFEGIYPKDRKPKMEDGGDYDPDDTDNSDLHLLIDGWITITPFHTTEQRRVIGGVRQFDMIGYSFQRVEVTAGCVSGPPERCYPDEVDIVEVELPEPINHPTHAIEKVCKMLFNNELQHVGEAFGEAQMIAEEESETYA